MSKRLLTLQSMSSPLQLNPWRSNHTSWYTNLMFTQMNPFTNHIIITNHPSHHPSTPSSHSSPPTHITIIHHGFTKNFHFQNIKETKDPHHYSLITLHWLNQSWLLPTNQSKKSSSINDVVSNQPTPKPPTYPNETTLLHQQDNLTITLTNKIPHSPHSLLPNDPFEEHTQFQNNNHYPQQNTNHITT